MPGLPGVVIGHNDRIGWGITAGRADTQDLYVEQRHPDQPTWFRHGDEWTTAQVLQEEIQVRGQAEPHLQEVVITRHGPLINGLVPAEHAGQPAAAGAALERPLPRNRLARHVGICKRPATGPASARPCPLSPTPR